MDVLKLSNGNEINLEAGGTLSSLWTKVEDFNALEELANKLNTEENLKTVKILSDQVPSAEYANLTQDTTFKCVDVMPDGITVEIALRPMTDDELRAEDVKTAITYLSDEQALTVVELYPQWVSKKQYIVGERYTYGGDLYRCLQDHAAQDDWTPDAAPSLWAKILNPDPAVIPEWEQPESTNGYSINDKVKHNGKVWESLVDNNVWEPGVEGTEELWKELLETE